MGTGLSDWDAQMKFSAILPDFAEWLQRMADASAGSPPPLMTVPYGPDPRQFVELHAGTGPATTAVVFFHGGYWRALEAATHRFVLPGLSRLGAHLANAEYRLMPGVRLGEVVADATQGVQAVLMETGASRVILAGHSAGAHLALSALRDPAIREIASGAILISGVYDLAPVSRSFLQAELGLSEEEVALYSHARIPDGVPSLVLAGEKETDLFRSQAMALAQASEAARAAEIQGAHHMNILFGLEDPKSPVARAIEMWLNTGKVPNQIEGNAP